MKTKYFIILIALFMMAGNNSVNAQVRKTQKRTAVKKPVSKQQTHQAIDLGLPSGTKWASCNVGANKPEEYGDYYAWGETTTKKEYTVENYRFRNIVADVSGTQYDVARAKWGGKWRMPTNDEVNELVDNCKYERTTLNGVIGGMFTGPNGNSIFLPAACFRYRGDLINYIGEFGNYWSSALVPDDSDNAFGLAFDSKGACWDGNLRLFGRSVRPVISSDNENKQIKGRNTSSQSKTTQSQTQPKTTTSRAYTTCPDNNHPHIIDLGLPSGTKWACCNVDANKPEDYGGYYAWGETSTKTEYSSSNYRYDQVNLGNDISGTQYDVAHVKWGGKWQMPTKEQINELDDNCKYEWTTLNGVKGGKFTGPNGNSIFLPAAGGRWGGELYDGYGRYWSSTQTPPSPLGFPLGAYYLGSYSGITDCSSDHRGHGRSVRPVVRN